jgi:hypothetical protein
LKLLSAGALRRTPCRGVSEFTSYHLTRTEWHVDNLAARGARASGEEFDVIVKPLAKNFGKE